MAGQNGINVMTWTRKLLRLRLVDGKKINAGQRIEHDMLDSNITCDDDNNNDP